MARRIKLYTVQFAVSCQNLLNKCGYNIVYNNVTDIRVNMLTHIQFLSPMQIAGAVFFAVMLRPIHYSLTYSMLRPTHATHY